MNGGRCERSHLMQGPEDHCWWILVCMPASRSVSGHTRHDFGPQRSLESDLVGPGQCRGNCPLGSIGRKVSSHPPGSALQRPRWLGASWSLYVTYGRDKPSPGSWKSNQRPPLCSPCLVLTTGFKPRRECSRVALAHLPAGEVFPQCFLPFLNHSQT